MYTDGVDDPPSSGGGGASDGGGGSDGGDGQADLLQSEYARQFRLRGRTVLELHSEIDLAAQLEIEPYLDMITAGPAPQVVIDLRPVEFIDCSGLRLLLRARSRVEDRDGRLRLVCDEGSPAHRILRRCRLLGVLEPVATLAEALGQEP